MPVQQHGHPLDGAAAMEAPPDDVLICASVHFHGPARIARANEPLL